PSSVVVAPGRSLLSPYTSLFRSENFTPLPNSIEVITYRAGLNTSGTPMPDRDTASAPSAGWSGWCCDCWRRRRSCPGAGGDPLPRMEHDGGPDGPPSHSGRCGGG